MISIMGKEVFLADGQSGFNPQYYGFPRLPRLIPEYKVRGNICELPSVTQKQKTN